MKEYIAIILPSELYDPRFELIQKELFYIGYEWIENGQTIKNYYPHNSSILLFNYKMYLIDIIDLEYIGKKNKMTKLDIKSYIRYLKIKKMNYGK